MAHHTSNTGEKRRARGKGAYDPRFVSGRERINPQDTENFSSSFLIRGVVILNLASGVACEFVEPIKPIAPKVRRFPTRQR